MDAVEEAEQRKDEYNAMQTLRQVAGMLGVTGNVYKDAPLAVRALQVRLRDGQALETMLHAETARANQGWVRYDLADAERQELRQAVAAKQAVIDYLMMEYCPDEMTLEQLDTWAAAQRKVAP